MEDFIPLLSVVALEKGKGQLRKELPGQLFRDEISWTRLFALCSCLLQEGFVTLDQGREVTASTVLHDDVELSLLFVDDSVVVPCDVGVFELTENVNLRNQLLLLFLCHLTIVKLFPDKNPAIRNPPDLADLSKTP